MQALVLVGGEGTRLRPLTARLPKPVVPLVDRPFLRYMIDWLAGHGVHEVILACGFEPAKVREVLGDGGGVGPTLRYVTEPEPRGTAGAMRFSLEYLDERFLALNGDVLTDLDLSALMRLHAEREAKATLGLYPVDDPSGYGLVHRTDDGEVEAFIEKPGTDAGPIEMGRGEINAGTYVLERSVIEGVAPDGDVSIERDVFPGLIGNGLYGARLEGYWMDIGTPDRYLQASWDILEGAVITPVGERLGPGHRHVDEGASVDPSAVVHDSVLVEAGAVIEAGAVVGPRAVIGADCVIGANAVVEASVLHAGCRVGDGASLHGAILAAGADIEPGAEPPPGIVIGEGERVEV